MREGPLTLIEEQMIRLWSDAVDGPYVARMSPATLDDLGRDAIHYGDPNKVLSSITLRAGTARIELDNRMPDGKIIVTTEDSE